MSAGAGAPDVLLSRFFLGVDACPVSDCFDGDATSISLVCIVAAGGERSEKAVDIFSRGVRVHPLRNTMEAQHHGDAYRSARASRGGVR